MLMTFVWPQTKKKKKKGNSKAHMHTRAKRHKDTWVRNVTKQLLLHKAHIIHTQHT